MIVWPQRYQILAPAPSPGVAGYIDIGAIKSLVQTVLDTANDPSGDPIDLSRNLVNRVSKVLKVNPEKIRPDANVFPCVTIFLREKSMASATIAKDQVNGKRKCKLEFNIVGLMWNDNMTTYKEDPADNDLENLMENIEEILRHYATLNNLCNWQIPTAVTYHSSGYDEQTHMRVGILNLEVTIFY